MSQIKPGQRTVYSGILKLTLPIVLQNLLSAAVSSADVLMLNCVGQEHISAVSLAAQYASILFMILYGLGTGVTMLSAQYFGKGDMRAVDAVEGIALRFSVGISLLFSVAALSVPEWMMRVFTPDPTLISIGSQYLRYVSAAYICSGLIEIYLATLRSVGRVAVSTALNTVTFTLNILLNALFIFGPFEPPLRGAAGVALATSISRVVELVLSLFVSARSRDIRLKLSHMLIRSKVLFRDFLRMAMPATLNDVSWGLAFSMYSVIIGQFLGTDMVAANSFTSLVRTFGTVLCCSVASGGGILLGQLLGSGQMDEAEKSARALMKLTVLSGLAGGLIVLASMPFVLRFANLTETGKGFLRGMLWINTYYVMGQAVNTTLIAGVFRAGGDSRFGFICDSVDMWLYAVPLGFLAAAVLKLPPMWVYFLLCTDEFVKWPWVIGHYRSRKWLRNITRENIME